MREYHLAVIAGDGIGREVMPEAVATLDAVAEQVGGLRFTYQHFDWGSERYLAHGAMMAQNGLASLERGGFAAVLLGPVGDPRVADHISLWGCCCRYARASTSMSISARCACCQASRARSSARARPRSTWSACAKTRRASTPASAVAWPAAHPMRSLSTRLSSPATGRSESCATPSNTPARGMLLAGTAGIPCA